jgi:acetolactate synthase-1/2/3 large subunit
MGDTIMEHHPNLHKGWGLVGEALMDAGVRYIFSVPGESISPIQLSVEGKPIEIVSTRHEQAATFMAEAYGRMTGRPGVALVTFGPGFTNTISAVVDARLSNSPLVLIAGGQGAGSEERLGLQDMRQGPIMESIVKKNLVCRKAERIPEFIDMAFRQATYGRPGPVFLELPIDVLEATVENGKVKKIHTDVASRPVDPDDARKMIEMIKACTKPVIMAGSGAFYSKAGKELVRFVEKTGIPAFTAKMARGIIPDTHPLCFESSVPVRPGCSGLAMTGADLVILLGSRLCLFSGNGQFFGKDAKLVQVDIEPEEIGRNRAIDHAVFADIKAFLSECNRIIEKEGNMASMHAQFKDWVEALRENEKASKLLSSEQIGAERVPIHPGRLAKEVDEFMDRMDDIVISDGGDAMSWMLTTRTCRAELNVLDSGLFGCLGMGIPFGNAAKLINPARRVLVYTGDGSIGFNFMEIETSIRKRLPIVVVIDNNQKWGMTSNSMMLEFNKLVPGTVEIGYVPYHQAVEALGGKGILVKKTDEIKHALEEAFASGTTTCINVLTDSGIIGPGSAALASLKTT